MASEPTKHRVPYTLRRNWQEEHASKVGALAEFLDKRSNGDLEVQRFNARIEKHNRILAPAALSGDPASLIIQLECSSQRLAVCVDEKESSAQVSAIQETRSIFRTCFLLKSAAAASDTPPQLCYGDETQVTLCSPLEHLSLMCKQPTTASGERSISFATAAAREAHWIILKADPIERQLSTGMPVAFDDLVVLRHAQSGYMLCLSEQAKLTDFGEEAGVTVSSTSLPGKRMICEQFSQVPGPLQLRSIIDLEEALSEKFGWQLPSMAYLHFLSSLNWKLTAKLYWTG